MEKIIIHNYTQDTSYAFTLAEFAYKMYEKSLDAQSGLNAKYELDGHIVSIRVNDKSVTCTVKDKKSNK